MALKCHSPQNCPYSVAIIDGSYMYYFYSDGNGSNLEVFFQNFYWDSASHTSLTGKRGRISSVSGSNPPLKFV